MITCIGMTDYEANTGGFRHADYTENSFTTAMETYILSKIPHTGIAVWSNRTSGRYCVRLVRPNGVYEFYFDHRGDAENMSETTVAFILMVI